MAQDCNQRIFGTGLSASIHLPRTRLSASETAINRLGPHYMQLYALTVLSPSLLALTRLRIWRAPQPHISQLERGLDTSAHLESALER
jgi:hypothetical protein